MADYNSLKGNPDFGFAEPKASTDPDHLASKGPNELANRAAVTVAAGNPTNLPGPVNVGGLKVTPGQSAPQFAFEAKAGPLKALPIKFSP